MLDLNWIRELAENPNKQWDAHSEAPVKPQTPVS